MKLSGAIRKEMTIVALGTLLCSLILQGVFWLLSLWDKTVLLGNLYSWLLSCLNFLWLGLTVRKASAYEDPDAASRKIKRGQLLRWILVGVLVIVGVLLHRYFHTVAVLVPLLFPQLVLILRGILRKDPP